MKRELIKLANHLDRIGLVKEANYVDALVKIAADPMASSEKKRRSFTPLFEDVDDPCEASYELGLGIAKHNLKVNAAERASRVLSKNEALYMDDLKRYQIALDQGLIQRPNLKEISLIAFKGQESPSDIHTKVARIIKNGGITAEDLENAVLDSLSLESSNLGHLSEYLKREKVHIGEYSGYFNSQFHSKLKECI